MRRQDELLNKATDGSPRFGLLRALWASTSLADYSQAVARFSQMSKSTLVRSGFVLSPNITFSVTAMFVFPRIAHLAFVVDKEHFKHVRDVTVLIDPVFACAPSSVPHPRSPPAQTSLCCSIRLIIRWQRLTHKVKHVLRVTTHHISPWWQIFRRMRKFFVRSAGFLVVAERVSRPVECY